jgi:hypothetical protein
MWALVARLSTEKMPRATCPGSTQQQQQHKHKGLPKPNQKNRGPLGEWVGQRPKMDQGHIFVDIFLGGFELPSPKNAQNREKKSVLDFLSILL